YSSATAALAGRPTVLFAGFGATVVAGSTQAPRDSWINDGRTTVSHGGRVSTEHSPTFRLAGDEPVTLIGTVINPTSDQDAGRQLRTFRIETSLDGVTYQPVLEAGLSAARVDQAFEFGSPVTARFARLVGIDAHGGVSPSYFGEWKLISDDPALFSGLDLALPELGGNVVWSRPLLGSGDHIDVLSVAGNVGFLDLR